MEEMITDVLDIFYTINEDTLTRSLKEFKPINVFILRNGEMRSFELRMCLKKMINTGKVAVNNGIVRAVDTSLDFRV